MALSRRCIIYIFKNQHFRYYSDKSGSNFWEIVPKQWRQPRFPMPDENSLKIKLAPSLEAVRFLNKFNPFQGQVLDRKKNLQDELDALQEIVGEDIKERGRTASLAQFLVFQGAKVRFSSAPEWISSEENYDKMPSVNVIGSSLVGIDMSHSNIDYATVRLIQGINTVTYFSAEACAKFDDYCLDYMSANLQTIEELNLSHCPLITSRGLGILHRFKKLRILKLEGIQSDAELELICVLLEEHLPNLTIEGVAYLSYNKTSSPTGS